jgi:hypothetical protein
MGAQAIGRDNDSIEAWIGYLSCCRVACTRHTVVADVTVTFSQ